MKKKQTKFSLMTRKQQTAHVLEIAKAAHAASDRIVSDTLHAHAEYSDGSMLVGYVREYFSDFEPGWVQERRVMYLTAEGTSKWNMIAQ